MNEALEKRSIHELRSIAQAFGITDIFEKDDVHLRQEIELKQQAMISPPMPLPERPAYDARLMTSELASLGDRSEITELLAEHIRRGLNLRFEDEHWFMGSGKKTDSGTLRMPMRDILGCAEKVIK